MKEIINLRPYIFIILIVILSLIEFFKPNFKNHIKQRKRTNWLIFISSIISMRVVIPIGISGIIFILQEKGIYLFPLFKISFVFDLIITIIIFDFLIYWQHRSMHIFNILWKMHKVHHSDEEMDFTTALRFHPFEIIFSAIYKTSFLMIFSTRPEVFISYEILLNSMALFNHSNIRINKSLDAFLRLIIVTPAMHFPHHSETKRLMNKNYGNFLSIWDRIFNSYTTEKVDKFGISEKIGKGPSHFISQLFAPLK